MGNASRPRNHFRTYRQDGVLIEQEKELREALRVARSSNAKGWSAKLAAANVD